MAGRAKKIPDEKLAQKIHFSPLNLIKGILIFVGKPFYLLLSYLIIGLLFTFYLIGHGLIKFLSAVRFLLSRLSYVFVLSVRSLFKLVSQLSFKKPSFKIKPPKIALPKLELPKITLKLNLRKLSFFLFPLLIVFSFWFFILKDLPSPKELTTRNQEVTTKIYDRSGVLLYKIYKNQNRTPITLKEIPLTVRQATLAAEDAEFYSHIGFSIRGITRAIIKNLKEGKLSGGSTITQQLVKNALLTPEKTLIRKIKEVVLSFATELTFNKDQILEMYLNEVSYGGTAYGIYEASQVYFGKKVKDLSLSEAALLAGLPQSPTKYSPFGTTPDLAFARQKEVLNLMADNKYITQEEASQAKEERLTFSAKQIDIKAPHFVMYVRQQLVDKYGEDMVEKGGLEVTTSLDYQIQTMAEKVVVKEIDKVKSLRVGNGAALVLNPQTGEILAMVGSKNYFDINNNGNVNVTTSLRQPGSSIKVVNYAYALAHGFTPASILDDSPVSFSVPGSETYSPKNYDGKFRGKLTLRSALAESRNIPAVKVLASYGVANMLDQGKQMGITTWDKPSSYGLSLTLGGGEVKLIDLARVYATIANLGNKPEITTILSVKNYQGKLLEENTHETQSVLDARVAYMLVDILKDNTARAPSFGANSALVIANHPEVAVKTGTSNNMKDNLTLGFNQNFLVAVWVGNNDSSPMSGLVSGITGAAPIFNRIMTTLLKEKDVVQWPVPEGLVKTNICSLTGTLPCQGCPTKQEWFLKENVPTRACLPEWFVKKDSEQTPTPQILEPAVRIQALN